jgi:pyruvate dehydrogenase E2 component (dihydrolipoamide acetyltransferase)
MSRIKEFPLPDLGEGLTEGEILKWLVSVGDTIELNQPIVEIETEKAAVEIPAKWAGRVKSLFCAEGEVVAVGTAIIAIDTDPTAASDDDDPEPGMIGGAAPGGRTAVLVGYGPKNTVARRRPRKAAPGAAPAVSAEPVVDTEPVGDAGPVYETEPAVETGMAVEGAAALGERPLAKPPVRRLAKDLGVDLYALTGSGPNGSISREDVRQAGQQPTVSASASDREVPAASGPGREQRVAVKGVRRLTAANMVASAFTAPHATEFLTLDMTRSIRALDRIRELPDWRDVRASPLLLVAKAVLLGLSRYPMINSCWVDGRGDTDEIVIKEYVNLGIAAATPRGLIVPNIKDAGRLGLRDLAEAMTALVGTARDGRTTPADMSGGTFTITNVGVFGVDTGTPILPPGEAAILAFGAVREMPWVHKGKIKIRQVTTLGLSFDHRIIDGELGSRFLSDVGTFLTDPEAALLGWA